MTQPNPQMSEVLEALGAFHPKPIPSLEARMARDLPDIRDAVIGVITQHMLKRVTPGVIEHVAYIDHQTISTPNGGVLARIYKYDADKTDLPVLVYFHGGGWVIANLNTYDASCRSLANLSECIVVSVAYHQAPESKYPAAHDDAFAAYQWVLDNARTFGGDPQRVAIAGESAGGNLAASVCLRARDEEIRLPIHQLLVYPITDDDMNTESYQVNADAKPLNKEMMAWFFDQYIEDRNSIQNKEYLFPLKASDLSGLPPATIILAEIDPLRSEGEAYAEKLKSFGVPVSLREFNGVTHEFFGMKAVLDEAKEAHEFACDELQVAFDRGETSETRGVQRKHGESELFSPNTST